MRGKSVSVIVPIRVDHPAFAFYLDRLLYCLYSLVGQADVVVVDYGSTDPYQAIIAWIASQFGAFRACVQADQWNRGAAFNAGVRYLSDPSLLIFVDCDVLLPPDYVEQHEAFHRENSGFVASSRVFHLDKASGTPGKWFDGKDLPGQAVRGWSHFSLHRDLFEEVGGFDEVYSGWGAEDDDLLLRLKRAGATWQVIEGNMPIHAWHPHFCETSRQIGRETEAASARCNREIYMKRLKKKDTP